VNHDDFLQTIIDQPDDDAPRLIYADWLEDRGDPRAEFIRVQIELARMSTADPRREKLQKREQVLLKKHEEEWAAPLRGVVWGWAFGRGFIDRITVELDSSRFTEAFRLAPIQYLRDISQEADFRYLVKAGSLLKRLRGLEFWSVYFTQNEKVGKKLFSSPYLANLNTLIVCHDRNGDMLRDSVLQTLITSPHRSRLTELMVGTDAVWRGLKPRLVQAIARSSHLTNLKKLSLSHAQLDREAVKALATSPHLSQLVELDVARCGIGAAGWRTLLRSPTMNNLRRLNLSRTGLRDSDPEVRALRKRCQQCQIVWDQEWVDIVFCPERYWSHHYWGYWKAKRTRPKIRSSKKN
jgi:uncharacterized protein (TIGR02996 family)